MSIDGMLMEGERVIKEWGTREWHGIYATQHRVFLVRDPLLDMTVVEVPYVHISSLEYGRNRPMQRLWGAMVPLVLYLVTAVTRRSPYLAMFLSSSVLEVLQALFLLVAAGLLAWFFLGKGVFTIHVNGRPSIHVSRELRELYQLARRSPIEK
ncbi:hypothetical protein GF319_11150 [Candidatus Bathyarchaeota archaeon]|nr:hypothetical protein [Candidatus Bathyarchaeota archaeon]